MAMSSKLGVGAAKSKGGENAEKMQGKEAGSISDHIGKGKVIK